MVRLFLFCCLLITSFVRADTIHVYCDDWPGFCHRDGKGVYLDVVRAIYEPLGHEVKLHMVPYKRALAVVSQKEGDMAMGRGDAKALAAALGRGAQPQGAGGALAEGVGL